MFFTILFVIALIVLVGLLLISRSRDESLRTQFQAVRTHQRLVVGLILLCLLGIFSPCQIVPPGHKGVVLTWGKVTSDRNPGLALKVPLVQTITILSTKPNQLDLEIPVGPEGANTKDNQTVGAKITVFYKYSADKVKSVVQDYGIERLDEIITKSTIECFKTEIGKHVIFDIPINQAEIQDALNQNLKAKIVQYPMEITDTKIVNYDWSAEFDNQIKATMERAQQVKQKAQELLITEQEAQKQVKIATADKESKILAAQADSACAALHAIAKAMEGEGIRKYNQSVQANMDLELKIRTLEIEKIKAQKWNGEYVPTNNYGPIPIQSGFLQPSK